ncbi:Protein MAIN-LIKE 1 [Glycine max]|nr:Protein MAIN-LIKE 1 [Glycine max]
MMWHHLLHPPITSAFHTFDAIDVDEAMDLLVELLEVNTQEAKDETDQCKGAYVLLAWLRDIYCNKCDASKSVTHISVVFLDAYRDLSQSGVYSWGAAALVHMYDNLNVASKHTTKHLAGYITLLQCWIYENPTIASII